MFIELESNKNKITCEIRLWREVINQALIDLYFVKATNKMTLLDYIEVLEWFTNESGDFEYVCHLANVDTKFIKKIAIEILKVKKLQIPRRKHANIHSKIKRLINKMCTELEHEKLIHNPEIQHTKVFYHKVECSPTD